METVKEKLVKILKDTHINCTEGVARCGECEFQVFAASCCCENLIADRLVKRGVTIEKTAKMEIKTDEYDCEYMMCTSCKEEMYPVDEDTVDVLPKYCPNCGARIEGKA